MYNLTLLAGIVRPAVQISETVSEGDRMLPRVMCHRGWSAK